MNFKVGEDIVCINDKFKQVFGKSSEFDGPKKDEIVTIKAIKDGSWLQLERYYLNKNGIEIFFSQDRFRKLTAEDLELTEELEEVNIKQI